MQQLPITTFASPHSECFIKGVVCWYCSDEKPFNITACFIIKSDTKYYDYALKMAGHEQQCTMYHLL